MMETKWPNVFAWRIRLPHNEQEYNLHTYGRLEHWVEINPDRPEGFSDDFLVWNLHFSGDTLQERSRASLTSNAIHTREKKVCEFYREHFSEFKVVNHLDESSVSAEGRLRVLSVYIPEKLFDKLDAVFLPNHCAWIKEHDGLLARLEIWSEEYQRSQHQ